MVRIPAWARNEVVPSDLYRFETTKEETWSLRVNGEVVQAPIVKGYASVERTWRAGDVLTLELPMPVRKIRAHENVKDNRGRFALQKGPVVFAVEGKDQVNPAVLNLFVSEGSTYQLRREDGLLNGVDVVTFMAGRARKAASGSVEQVGDLQEITAIPYYAWANRGPGEMIVWLADDPEVAAQPLER